MPVVWVCWGQTLELKELRVMNEPIDPSISQHHTGVLRYELARLVETLFPHQAHLPEFRPILATWQLVTLVGCEWMYGILDGCGAGSYRLVFFLLS